MVNVANIFPSVSDLSFDFTFGILFCDVTVFNFYIVNFISFLLNLDFKSYIESLSHI